METCPKCGEIRGARTCVNCGYRDHWSDLMPPGTVAIVGHPANGVTATKAADGRWMLNGLTDGMREVDFDTRYKGMSLLHRPDDTPTAILRRAEQRAGLW